MFMSRFHRVAPRTLIVLGILAATTACDRAAVPEPRVDALPPAATPAPRSDAFDVVVSLSPVAAKQLAQTKEGIIVSADYFGYPTVAAQQQQLADPREPWMTLKRAQIELGASGGTAHFAAARFDEKQLGLIEKGEPQVNINVYSARKASQDNVLDCGMFQDTLQVAAQEPIKIECKLIAE